MILDDEDRMRLRCDMRTCGKIYVPKRIPLRNAELLRKSASLQGWTLGEAGADLCRVCGGGRVAHSRGRSSYESRVGRWDR